MVKDVELWPQRPGFDSRPWQIFFHQNSSSLWYFFQSEPEIPGLQDPLRPTVHWGRALCRLRQHLVKDQTRVRRIPFLGRHPWRQKYAVFANTNRKKASHSNPLWSRKIPDAKPRPNSCSTASGVSLEKIFTKPTTEAVQKCSPSLRAGLQSLLRHTSSQILQRRHARSCSRQPQGQSTRQRTRQHLHSCFHHLPRTTQTALVPRTTSATRALLRHGLHYLHHQTRAITYPSRRLPGRNDEWTRWQRRHHRVHVCRS